MKNVFFAILTLAFFASCSKEPVCTGEQIQCWRTVLGGFTACPDSKNPNHYEYTDIEMDTFWFDVNECDREDWIRSSNQYVNNLPYMYPTDKHWEIVAKQNPGNCGCE